jgi:tripartite-type tricarboxylate transporter receptor subunit TctC
MRFRASFSYLKISIFSALLAPALVIANSASAQTASNYPNRPVQLIIAYGAGTIGDVSMRIVAERLTTKLGKPFVVENRPGAAGVIAAKAASVAAPDGYTLLLTGNSYAISTAWFKSVPYDFAKEFVSISGVATFDFLVANRARRRTWASSFSRSLPA